MASTPPRKRMKLSSQHEREDDDASEKSQRKCVNEGYYDRMRRYVLSHQQLRKNDYPRPSSVHGRCEFAAQPIRINTDKTKKECWRCHKKFVLYQNGQFEKESDICRHSQGICQNHVHRDNLVDCGGYLDSLGCTRNGELPGIYAVDCEMCYTVVGLELIRVSVVDFDCKPVYDSLVKPEGRIVDYNTKWSGVDEEDLKGIETTLSDVHDVFKDKFSSDTIFVGHSLESDLKALRIIHSTVIDTSVTFPHRRGFPYKRALRHLVRDHLGLIIQSESKQGHDSTEDAVACVKLMKWKLRRDTKFSR